MLKILEARRDKLQQQLQDAANPDEKSSDVTDAELKNRLTLYTDYEHIQLADEHNIKIRLQRLAHKAWDRATQGMDGCTVCKKTHEYDPNVCRQCRAYAENHKLIDLMDEAYTALDILSVANKIRRLPSC